MRAPATVPLRYALREIDVRADHAGSETPPLLTVSIHSGVRRRDEVTGDEHRADSIAEYKRCESGDLVVNRMRAFQGALGVAPTRGLVSPDYAVLRPLPAIDVRLIAYVLRSRWGLGEMTSRLRGIGGVSSGMVRTPRINVAELLDIRIPGFSFEQQRRIAELLDRESERIAAAAAPLTDLTAALDRSLGDWFRDATVNALEVPLRRVIASVSDGPFGSSLASAHYVDEPGVRVIRLDE